MGSSPLRTRPEAIAGIVNAVVIMLIPAALLLAGAMSASEGGNALAYTGTPSEIAAKKFADRILPVLLAVLMFSPVAAFAGWRTWVHARRYRQGETGGRGVLEAGMAGLLIALVALAVPTVRNPSQAPPYLIVYGGGSFLVGLLLGCVLWITAVAALYLAPDAPVDDSPPR